MSQCKWVESMAGEGDRIGNYYNTIKIQKTEKEKEKKKKRKNLLRIIWTQCWCDEPQIKKSWKGANTWILLDNQSTVDVFFNRNILSSLGQRQTRTYIAMQRWVNQYALCAWKVQNCLVPWKWDCKHPIFGEGPKKSLNIDSNQVNHF